MAVVFAGGVAAGQEPPVPPRPPLASGQDTNSAEAYVAFGMSQIPDHPKIAAAAFYWATRLDPGSGAAWYGRWTAHLLDPDTPPPGSYTLPGDFAIGNPLLQDPDSLRSKALLREPLLYVRFDFIVADELMRRQSRGRASLYQTDDPTLRAEIDFSIGRFGEATRTIEEAIHAHRSYYSLHIDRARAFALQTQYDSAIHELQLYLAAPNHLGRPPIPPDDRDPMVEYAIARLQQLKGDLASAKTSYEQALAADSAFLVAHAGLAGIALAQRDQPTALRELGRAAATGDPPTCYAYGLLLIRAGRPADAAAQFGLAIAADSDYAPPYYPLAVIEEAAGFDTEALAHYTRFLARAPRALRVSVDSARARVGRLQGAAPRPN